jgi:hypothetical protein
MRDFVYCNQPVFTGDLCVCNQDSFHQKQNEYFYNTYVPIQIIELLSSSFLCKFPLEVFSLNQQAVEDVQNLMDQEVKGLLTRCIEGDI